MSLNLKEHSHIRGVVHGTTNKGRGDDWWVRTGVHYFGTVDFTSLGTSVVFSWGVV